MQSEIEGQTEGQTDQSQNTIQRSCRDHPACSDYLERKKERSTDCKVSNVITVVFV